MKPKTEEAIADIDDLCNKWLKTRNTSCFDHRLHKALCTIRLEELAKTHADNFPIRSEDIHIEVNPVIKAWTNSSQVTVQIIHIPTDIIISLIGYQQHKLKAEALLLLQEKLNNLYGFPKSW